MSTMLAIKPADMDAVKSISAVARDTREQLAVAKADGDDLAMGLIIARATRQLQALLNDNVMQDIMCLQGNRLGFKTDKDTDKGYTLQVVRDCTIQALIRGARMVGNEVNIIAGQPYITKEGYERIVREIKGLTNLELNFQVPEMLSGRALVACTAKWKYFGQDMEIEKLKTVGGDYRIPVKVNSAMGDDAILGKATRKLLALVHNRILGLGDAGLADYDPDEDANLINHRPAVHGPGLEPKQAVIESQPVTPLNPQDEAMIIAELEHCKDRPQVESMYKRWINRFKNKQTTQYGPRLAELCKCRIEELEYVQPSEPV